MLRTRITQICARLWDRSEDYSVFPPELGKLIQQAYQESLAHGGDGRISSLDILVVCLERLAEEEPGTFSNISVLPDDVRAYSKSSRDTVMQGGETRQGGNFEEGTVPAYAVSRIVISPLETPSRVTKKVFSVLMLDPQVQECIEALNRSPRYILTHPTGLI